MERDRNSRRARHEISHSRKENINEEKFTRLEETRQSALEMAQEEDEKKKESTEDAQTVTMITRRYRLTWQTGGLQLSRVIENGFADS